MCTKWQNERLIVRYALLALLANTRMDEGGLYSPLRTLAPVSLSSAARRCMDLKLILSFSDCRFIALIVNVLYRIVKYSRWISSAAVTRWHTGLREVSRHGNVVALPCCIRVGTTDFYGIVLRRFRPRRAVSPNSFSLGGFRAEQTQVAAHAIPRNGCFACRAHRCANSTEPTKLATAAPLPLADGV